MAKFPPLITPEMHAEDAYDSHMNAIGNVRKCMSYDLEQLENLCKKIDKLQTASPSLDKMLDISNEFRLLETSQAQVINKKTTKRKTR